jgi:hypothetical protein
LVINSYRKNQRPESWPIELKLLRIANWIEEQTVLASAVEACVVGRLWLRIATQFLEQGLHKEPYDKLRDIVEAKERELGMDTEQGLLEKLRKHPESFLDPVSPLPIPEINDANNFWNPYQKKLHERAVELYESNDSEESKEFARIQLWITAMVGCGKTTAIVGLAEALNTRDKVATRGSIAHFFVTCPQWWAVFDLIGHALVRGVPVSVVDDKGTEQFAWQTCGRGKDRRPPWITVSLPSILYPKLEGRARRTPDKLRNCILAIDEATQVNDEVLIKLLTLPIGLSILVSANLPIDRSPGASAGDDNDDNNNSPVKMPMPNWDRVMTESGVNKVEIIDSTNTPIGMKVVVEGQHWSPLDNVRSYSDLQTLGALFKRAPSLRRFFTVADLLHLLDQTRESTLVEAYEEDPQIDQGRVYAIFERIIHDLRSVDSVGLQESSFSGTGGASASASAEAEAESLPDPRYPTSTEGLIRMIQAGAWDLGQGLFFTDDPHDTLDQLVNKLCPRQEWVECKEKYRLDSQALEERKAKSMASLSAGVGKRSQTGDDLDSAYAERERDTISSERLSNLQKYIPKSIHPLLPNEKSDMDFIIQIILDADYLLQTKAIALLLGVGLYENSTKGSDYTTLVQNWASEGRLSIVISSLDPKKGAVFALNAPFAWCGFDDELFGDDSLIDWGVVSQAAGRVGRRGKSWHATCFLGPLGRRYLDRLFNEEENATFLSERRALDELARAYLAKKVSAEASTDASAEAITDKDITFTSYGSTMSWTPPVEADDGDKAEIDDGPTSVLSQDFRSQDNGGAGRSYGGSDRSYGGAGRSYGGSDRSYGSDRAYGGAGRSYGSPSQLADRSASRYRTDPTSRADTNNWRR